MNQNLPGAIERNLRVFTQSGVIEGHVHLPPRVRTLDDLNVGERRFITLHNAKGELGFQPADGTIAVSRDVAQIVIELTNPPEKAEAFAGSLARSPMVLRVGKFTVHGFVHAPQGGDPFKRLNQEKRPFLSVTSASVVAEGVQLAAPFLAVNRTHVAWAGHLVGDTVPQ